MRRHKESNRKRNKKFGPTASRVHKKNLIHTGAMRGGIRL